jgi:hypothetical protein
MNPSLRVIQAFTILLSSVVHATVISVPVDYSTIQLAIDNATDGDTVLVQPGTYVENVNINGQNIVVGSLFLTTGDTSFISQTVIDGGGIESVVSFYNEVGPSTVLTGFTIMNGSSYDGGGIHCEYANPTLSNLIVKNNRAERLGGGIFYLTGDFGHNLRDTTYTLRNILVKGNIAAQGGGIACSTATARMRGLVISNNSATISGGGITSSISFTTILNTIVCKNDAKLAGAGIYSDFGDTLIMRNSTVVYNTVTGEANDYDGHEIFGYSTTLDIINSIVWHIDESISVEKVIHAPGIVSFSDIQGGWSLDGEANIDDYPIFEDPNQNNFRLSEYSPAIGAGKASGTPTIDMEGNPRPNPPGSNPDMGAYEHSLGEPAPGPHISSIGNVIVLEDSSTSFTIVVDNWQDNNLRYEVFGPDHITVTIIDSLVILTPAANFYTLSSIPLYAKACAEYICGTVDTFYVSVVAVNDAPLATLGIAEVSDDEATGITLTGSAGPGNEAGQILTYVVTALPEQGSLATSGVGSPISAEELPYTLPSEMVYYQPPAERFLTSAFTYQVIDDGGTEYGGVDTSEPRTVTLTLVVTDVFTLSTGGPIEGGVALISNDILYAAASGERVYRFDDTGVIEYTLNVNGDIRSATTITPDHNIYIASTDYNLYSFNANGVNNPGWPLPLGAEATASVAMDTAGNVYIGTQNGIFQAVAPNGNVLWSYNVGGAVYASAAISVDNTLYVVNANGRLFAFDLDR